MKTIISSLQLTVPYQRILSLFAIAVLLTPLYGACASTTPVSFYDSIEPHTITHSAKALSPGNTSPSSGKELPELSSGSSPLNQTDVLNNPEFTRNTIQAFQGLADHNLTNTLKQQLLTAGSSALSSSLENSLADYGKAKIHVALNDKGKLTGSADFLTPLYDSPSTTVFIQAGGRSMLNDRYIGNLGLGQRLFFHNDWALGYNLFYDYDFTRHHSRAGIGGELWYDWLRLSSNVYLPVSSWKDSKDYAMAEERAAKGWDLKFKGYLPSYRNIAFTGSYTHWFGEHVNTFNREDTLNSNPDVWSYGVEYTPFPLITSGFHQDFSQGQHDTQFYLDFTWHFGMTLADQLDSNKVNQQRSIMGSRHDFVDRQNDIILEYRQKQQQEEIHFTQDGITLANTQTITASQTTTFKVQLLRNNQPYANALINWSTSQGQFTGNGTQLLTTTSLTDAKGYAEITLIPASAGQLTLTANFENIDTYKDFTVEAAPEQYQFSDNGITLMGTQNLLLTQPATFRVQLLRNHQPYANATINWTTTQGQLTQRNSTNTTSSSVTDDQGYATITLTPSAIGVLTLSAMFNDNITISKDFAVNSDLILSIQPNGEIYGHQTRLTAQLLEGSTPVPNIHLDWTLKSSIAGVTITPDTPITQADGTVGALITSQTNTGITLIVTAKDENNHTIAVQLYYVPFFTSIVLTPNSVSTTLNTPTPLTATVLNLRTQLANVELLWNIIGDTTGVTLSASSTTTNANGKADISITSSQAKTVTVRTALAQSPEIYQDSTITFTQPDYLITLLPGFKDIIKSTENTTLQVKVTDKQTGTPIKNAQVSWNLTSAIFDTTGQEITPSGTLGSTLTDENGIAQYVYNPNLTAGQAGSVTINAQLTINPTKTVTALLGVGFSYPNPSSNGWLNAVAQCHGTGNLNQGNPSSHTPSDTIDYQNSTNLPTIKQLQAVSGPSRPVSWPLNAWQIYYYWTGDAHGFNSLAGYEDVSGISTSSWGDSNANYGFTCLQ